MKNCHLLDDELWTLAQWRNTSFILTEDLDEPAGIGLMFENYLAAQRIFTSWQKILGEADTSVTGHFKTSQSGSNQTGHSEVLDSYQLS